MASTRSEPSQPAGEDLPGRLGAVRDLRAERLTLAARSPSWLSDDGPTRRAELATLVESWLTQLWETAIGTGRQQGLALAAVGSVARRDAGPASDLDLVLLHDGRALNRQAVSDLADRIWYPVWDASVRLDHSVRTPG